MNELNESGIDMGYDTSLIDEFFGHSLTDSNNFDFKFDDSGMNFNVSTTLIPYRGVLPPMNKLVQCL